LPSGAFSTSPASRKTSWPVQIHPTDRIQPAISETSQKQSRSTNGLTDNRHVCADPNDTSPSGDFCFLTADFQPKGRGFKEMRSLGDGHYLVQAKGITGGDFYGALDRQGNVAMPLAYLKEISFDSNNLARVERDGQSFYIDRHGKEYCATPHGN
jgi:hypothetical protein